MTSQIFRFPDQLLAPKPIRGASGQMGGDADRPTVWEPPPRQPGLCAPACFFDMCVSNYYIAVVILKQMEIVLADVHY